MAKHLGKANIGFIKECYGKGKKTGEIQELLKERFGLDVKYQTVYSHIPEVAKARKTYYDRPDVKADKKDYIKFSIHAKKIGEMADTVEQNTTKPKKGYVFSRKDGEIARKRILEYLEGEPGAHYRKILTDLDLNNGTLYFQLKRLEDEGVVFSKKNGASKTCKTRYYPLRKVEDHIYYSIQASPGITQAELAGKLEIDRPLVHYHAEKLIEKGQITKKKDGHEIRYRATEEKDLSIREDGTRSRVFNIVKENPDINLTRLAELLGVAAATVHYHAEKLAADHLISRERNGQYVRYRVTEER